MLFLIVLLITKAYSFDNFNKNEYKKPKVLTIETFNQEISSSTATFALFYAPW